MGNASTGVFMMLVLSELNDYVVTICVYYNVKLAGTLSRL